MILVTVGTIFPFDRLIKAVDEAVAAGIVPTDVVAQTGRSGLRPRHIRSQATYPKDVFDELVRQCQAMIGHAGTGTIAAALDNDKPLLVVPRLPQYGEVVNEHQVVTARRYEDLGCVLAAYNTDEIPARMAELLEFRPKRVPRESGRLVSRIRGFLESM